MVRGGGLTREAKSMTWSKQHYRANSGHRPGAVKLEVKSAILFPCIQKILCLALLWLWKRKKMKVEMRKWRFYWGNVKENSSNIQDDLSSGGKGKMTAKVKVLQDDYSFGRKNGDGS